MQKIFNISLPRTGTQSVNNFLNQNGYKSMHWIGHYMDIENIIKHQDTVDDLFNVVSKLDNKFDAFNDTPYNILHKKYLEKYPQANFILITRKFEDWIESKVKFNNKVIEKMTPFQKMFYSGYGSNNLDGLEYSRDLSKHHYKNIYESHIDLCKTHFASCDNFINIDLNDSSISKKLSNFLKIQNAIFFENVDFLKNVK